MRNRSKSKLTLKRANTKRNYSNKDRKSRSRRRSLAPNEKKNRVPMKFKSRDRYLINNAKCFTKEFSISSSDVD